MKYIWYTFPLLILCTRLSAQQNQNSLSTNQLAELSYNQLDSLMYLEYQKGKYAKAIPYMQAGATKAKEEFGRLDSTYAEYVSNLGFFYHQTGKYAEAEHYYKESKAIRAEILGKEHPSYATSVNNLAGLYHYLGNYEQAELFYLQAKDIRMRFFGETHEIVANSLNNLAALYKDMGAYDKAENLQLQALDILAKVKGENDPLYATSLNNLASLYKKTQKFKKAEELLLKAKAIRLEVLGNKHPYFAQSLNNLAHLYSEMGDYKAAEVLLLEALDIYGQVLGKEHRLYASTLNNLASLYEKMQKYEAGEPLLLQAKKIYKTKLGTEHPSFARSLNNLASLYYNMNELDTALYYCLKSIDANCAKIKNIPLNLEALDFAQLAQQDYYSNQQINSTILNLLKIIEKQYLETGNPEKLEQQYKVVEVAMQLNERLRNGLSSEEDKLRILRENTLFIQKGIETALLLENTKYEKEAFSFAELNKSVLLADAIKGNRARSFGDLPDTLINYEIALQSKLSKLRKKQYSIKAPETESSVNKEISVLQLEIDAFLTSIKSKYPKYHALKYESITAKVEDIQSFLDDKNTAFLEYLLTDSITYLFSITKEEFKVYSIDIKLVDLKSRIKEFRFLLSNYENLLVHRERAGQVYSDVAYWFYKKLLYPALKGRSFENLIIVPDGELGHIPFETFLVEKSNDQKETNYKKLHYLLNDYNISYGYSATLWKENHLAPPKSNNGEMLACAAMYPPLGAEVILAKNRFGVSTYSKGKMLYVDSVLLELRTPYWYHLRSELQSLPAARDEIIALSNRFSGDFILDSVSNEGFFKKNASKYAVVHLAMHGVLEKMRPMLSSLVFTENGDSLEDNFLQAYEISRMNLNADLVVLSACQTGYGKFEQGEGVVSLARSFMYAGVPSLVVSLWQVNDGSTAKIMGDFYQNLANGMTKAKALRLAKLTYIKEYDGLAIHPTFWSPFIQLGDSKPIYLKTKSTRTSWVSILLLLVGLSGLAFFFIRRRR